MPPLDTRNVGDGLVLLRSIPDAFTPSTFFDPQYRELLKKLAYGNEGDRQGDRAALPQMPAKMIHEFGVEGARILVPNGYLLRWCDKFTLAEGLIKAEAQAIGLKLVEVICWDTGRFGQGYRGKQRAQYLACMQKAPFKTWKTKGVTPVWGTQPSIPDVWVEKVPQHRYHPEVHPHAKPPKLIRALIEATTALGDVVIDPCSGGFVVMDQALACGRHFLGTDWREWEAT